MHDVRDPALRGCGAEGRERTPPARPLQRVGGQLLVRPAAQAELLADVR